MSIGGELTLTTGLLTEQKQRNLEPAALIWRCTSQAARINQHQATLPVPEPNGFDLPRHYEG